ncbi:hypothetical protein [Brevundimonas sp.]
MTLSPPDLESEEGRAAYRAELRKVALPLRWSGLGLIVLAALVCAGASQGWMGLPESAVVIGYGLLAVGWAMVIATVFLRTRHHRRRMAMLDGGAR